MNAPRDLSRLAARFPGVATGLAGGLAVFVLWRLFGLPSPGTLGRIVPAAWVIAGLISPRARSTTGSWAFLAAFAVSAAAWPLGRAVLLLCGSCAVAGIIPLLEAAGAGRAGPVRVLLPLAPLVILLVPFTGDEPYYASVALSMVEDGDLDATNNLRQYDPASPVSPELADASGLSHFQPAFPLLLIPGIPLGAAGFRIVCLILTAASASMLVLMLSRSGRAEAAPAGALALLLLPGAGLAGLAYPDWTAVGLVSIGALMASRGRMVPVVLCALALSMLKLRFLAAGAGLVIATLPAMSPRRRVACVAALAALVAAFLLADRTVLGGRLFWLRYGNIEALRLLWFRTADSMGEIAMAPVWMLLDQEAGLLWRAPWLIPAAFGFASAARRSPVARPLLTSAAVYTAVLVLWQPADWHSCPTPWGRPFMPLLPLFALGAASAIESRRGGGFFAVSVLASCACFAWPELRFNFLDGTDRVLEWLGGLTGHPAGLALPTMLRPDPVSVILWAAAWSLSAVLYGLRREGAALAVLPVAALAMSALSPAVPATWEAEDLTADYRIGCELYPASPDPRERMAFEGSRERMLVVREEGDAVLLPVPGGAGDSVRIRIELRALSADVPLGLGVSCAGSRAEMSVSTRARSIPRWVASVRRGQVSRPPWPGILQDSTVTVVLPAGSGDIVVISPLEPLATADGLYGIYLDRIRLDRR